MIIWTESNWRWKEERK